MNQQRSRRFRSAQEAQEKDEEKAEFMKLLRQQNGGILPDDVLAEGEKKTWDSNAITPGTPFMDILALSVRYWTSYKLNTDPAWAKIKVIISDATVPGEGEHKIMEFIRAQRSSPEHDPNTRHVIYGLDADLIMLGLGTHEPHFRVLREDVFFQEGKAGTCRICGQVGHKAAECRGEAKKKVGEFDEKGQKVVKKPFIWLHVSVLREYLAVEMDVPNQGFKMDLERAIDDWIFMCFFVGNDFLPHLPSLDIREQGIDTLIAIWRDNLPVMGGYVTKDGIVDFQRAQHILTGLAKQEDAIFRRRKDEEDRKEANQKRRKFNDEGRGHNNSSGRKSLGDNFVPQFLDLHNTDSLEKQKLFKTDDQKADGLTHAMVMNKAKSDVDAANQANKSAAAVMKEKLLAGKNAGSDQNGATPATPNGDKTEANGEADGTPSSASNKRKRPSDDEEGPSTPGRNSPVPAVKEVPSTGETPSDDVRMWETGYRDRYYSQKFHVGPENQEFRHQVARDYAEGLQWVLLYYFQGCPSWTWYYPHHYAPFAADFVDIGTMKPKYDLGKPFKPYEQLMGVMPAASNHTIPEAFHSLMTDEDSDIVDFYPENFAIDLNGKKWAWQGVALLPFIDEKRLLDAMNTKYPLLSEEEVKRNTMGHEALLFSGTHPLYEPVMAAFYGKKQGEHKLQLKTSTSEGLAGRISKNEDYMPLRELKFPLIEDSMPKLDEDHTMAVHYELIKSEHLHKSMLLNGVRFAPAALDKEDIDNTRHRAQNSGRSHGGVPFGNGHRGGRGDRNGGRGGRGRGNGNGNFNYGPPSSNSHHSFDPRNFPPPASFGAPPPGVRGPPVPVPPQFSYGQPPQGPPHYPNQHYGQGRGGYGQGPPPQNYQQNAYQAGYQGNARGGYQGGYQGVPPPGYQNGYQNGYQGGHQGSYQGGPGQGRGRGGYGRY